MAQNDIHSILLKFSDDIVETLQTKEDTSNVDPLSNTIQLLNAKQDIQFRMLNGAIDTLNQNMTKIVTILMDQKNDIVTTATVIPSIQPIGTDVELKHINVVTNMTPISFKEVEIDEEVEEVEEVEIDDEEVEIDEEVEEEVEDDEEEVEVEEVEAELEVEEWVYKGRSLFKDSENTVYANDSGEVGDAIGMYDPVKNIIRPVRI